MAKYYYISRPARNGFMPYADFQDDTDNEWKDKARALQIRRWRALKRAQRERWLTRPKQNPTNRSW